MTRSSGKRWLRTLALFLLLLAAARFTDCSPTLFWARRSHLTDLISAMLPPDWGYAPRILAPLLATVQMSVTGTALGSFLALLLAPLCAENLHAPKPLRWTLRLLVQVLRSFPTLILALLATFLFGLGTFSGTVAITVYTFAILTRLTYEDIESAELAPYHALCAMGAVPAKVYWRAVVPGIAPSYFSNVLYLLGLCCAASVFGIAMIYSATRYNNDNRKIIVQTAALLIGIVVYFGISMIDLEMLIKRWKWIAAFDVLFILLLKTPFGVSDDTGNTAWLKFPFLPVSIGPAEVVKITFIILLAWQLQWLREEKRDLRSFSAAFYVGGHTLGIAGLYFVISGDMGNALMFLLIFVVMSFVAGFALRWFALLFGASGAVIGGIIAFDLVPDSKKYMLNRFIVLFDHSYDVQHTGWQQTRSLLTIGGGGFWGQGYLHGTQSQAGVGSVPARHTDLIFAVIGEELGFVGATLAILLLVAIIIRVLVVGRRAAQPFHTYVCVGIASMVMFQMIINIGMCLFIMPVIGLTLPFFSYGGSSVVTLFTAMGFVSGIKKRTVVRRRPGRPLGSNAVY